MGAERVERVKIADDFVAMLSGKWSEPVQVAIQGRDEDGDLELIFRVIPAEHADALRESMEQARDWMREQQRHCRPPEYADLPADELDAIRGPSAAYGAVVYDLCASKLDAVLTPCREATHASTGKESE